MHHGVSGDNNDDDVPKEHPFASGMRITWLGVSGNDLDLKARIDADTSATDGVVCQSARQR
jgi:hypothetical protein